MDSHDNTARLGDSTVELPGPVVLRRIVPRQTALHELWRAPGSFARRYAILLGILLIAATADAITTLNNLLAYGIEVEAHPVQRWVSHMIGPHAGVPVAKVVQLMFVLLVAAWWRPWCGWILGICSLLYAAAAVSNYFLLL